MVLAHVLRAREGVFAATAEWQRCVAQIQHVRPDSREDLFEALGDDERVDFLQRLLNVSVERGILHVNATHHHDELVLVLFTNVHSRVFLGLRYQLALDEVQGN